MRECCSLDLQHQMEPNTNVTHWNFQSELSLFRQEVMLRVINSNDHSIIQHH